jgi:acylphosphatase
MPQASETIRTVHLRIRGLVQGVGYRAFVGSEARRLGVGGWVRNRRDGSVEAIFRGAPAQVEALIGLCRQGPQAAEVASLDVADVAEGAAFHGFEMRPTI